MSPSDKRRGAAQHASTTSTSSSALRSSRGSTIIAAPPRAQLGSNHASEPTESNDSSPHESGSGGKGSSTHSHTHTHISSSTSHHGTLSSLKDGSTTRSTTSKPHPSSSPSSSSANKDTQLREKDDKIAALQLELAELATQFELTLNKLSTNESETASFWQAKHSALNQQFLRVDTELRLLNAEVEIRMAEREEMRDTLEATEESLRVLEERLRAREDEVRNLAGHLNSMKTFISTNTRMEDQTTDQQFAEMMMKLMNGVQNWVIMHFKKARLDISAATDVEELLQLVPMATSLASQSKLALLQTIVSNILVDAAFKPYFAGLPDDQNEKFRQTERDLSELIPAEAINQWRASTLMLVRKHSADIIREHTACLIDGAVARLNHIIDAMTNTNATDSRNQSAYSLFSNAVELAQSLSTQKAVFRVELPTILPHEQVVYDPTTMEDIGGEEDEDLVGREISCVTFPSLIKIGDEAGGHMHFKNVLSKAKVLCAPE